jgi:hypothetical protein
MILMGATTMVADFDYVRADIVVASHELSFARSSGIASFERLAFAPASSASVVWLSQLVRYGIMEKQRVVEL